MLSGIMVDILCPHCDEEIGLDDDAFGDFICPLCDGEFTWDALFDEEEEEEVENEAYCPSCGASQSVPSSQVTSMICDRCETNFRIPRFGTNSSGQRVVLPDGEYPWREFLIGLCVPCLIALISGIFLVTSLGDGAFLLLWLIPISIIIFLFLGFSKGKSGFVHGSLVAIIIAPSVWFGGCFGMLLLTG